MPMEFFGGFLWLDTKKGPAKDTMHRSVQELKRSLAQRSPTPAPLWLRMTGTARSYSGVAGKCLRRYFENTSGYPNPLVNRCGWMWTCYCSKPLRKEYDRKTRRDVILS